MHGASPHPTSSPTQSSHNRRFIQVPARVACLAALVAFGLALLGWMSASPDALCSSRDVKILPPKEFPQMTSCSYGSLDEVLAKPDIIPTHHHPLVGRQAPDFELADAEGKPWSLRELRDGHPVVLIFYYGAPCIHCVRQLSEIETDLPLFREVGARVIAISASPPESMQEQSPRSGPFRFPLLLDPGNKVAQTYQVYRQVQDGTTTATMLFRHGTFVIALDGTVKWVNVGDAPVRRNAAILSQLAKVEGRLP